MSTTQQIKIQLKPQARRHFSCTIYATEECNLNCDYCFVYKWHERGLRGRFLEPETAKKIVDFLAKEADSIFIGWFGGEPTLNVRTIRYTYEYATKTYPNKRWVMGMTTNGVLLSNKEIIRRLDGVIRSVIFSIDGVEDAHDLHRKFRDGRGSWRYVRDGLINALNWLGAQNVTARLTLTPETVQYMFESVKYLIKLGVRKLFVGIVPELDWDIDALQTMYNQYQLCGEYILRLIIEKGYRIHFGQARQGFEHLVALRPRGRHSHCGTGRNGVCFDVDGTIWACHRFKGYKEFMIGHVEEGWYWEQRRKVMYMFDRLKALEVNKCPSTCPFRDTCTFHCLACNYEFFGDVNKTHRPVICWYNKACLDIAVKWFMVGRHYQNKFIDQVYIEPVQRESSRPDWGGVPAEDPQCQNP